MSFMQRSVQHLMAIKAAKELRKEIEQAGVENLRLLAENNASIVGTYLNGCSPQRKAEIRRDLLGLLSIGVTPDMILTALARQMPVLAPIMEGKEAYKQAELARIDEFLKQS